MGEEHDLKKNRLHMCVSDDFIKRVDDWRFANRIATRANAVRILVDYALEKMTPPAA